MSSCWCFYRHNQLGRCPLVDPEESQGLCVLCGVALGSSVRSWNVSLERIMSETRCLVCCHYSLILLNDGQGILISLNVMCYSRPKTFVINEFNERKRLDFTVTSVN